MERNVWMTGVGASGRTGSEVLVRCPVGGMLAVGRVEWSLCRVGSRIGVESLCVVVQWC